MQVVYPRCAAIDVAKKEIAVCVRTPGEAPGGRRTQVRKYKTFYGVLKEMCAWLRECGVTHVAMESTGIYSNPVFHALVEFGDFEVIKCNAAHVKNVPGRKTDLLTELIEVPAGHRLVQGRRLGAWACPAPRLAGHRGIAGELATPESGHAASYHLLAFSSLLLVAPARIRPGHRFTALDLLMCAVFRQGSVSSEKTGPTPSGSPRSPSGG